MGHLWRQVMRLLNSMDPQEWVLVLVGMIVVGLFCLRGSGSRARF